MTFNCVKGVLCVHIQRKNVPSYWSLYYVNEKMARRREQESSLHCNIAGHVSLLTENSNARRSSTKLWQTVLNECKRKQHYIWTQTSVSLLLLFKSVLHSETTFKDLHRFPFRLSVPGRTCWGTDYCGKTESTWHDWICFWRLLVWKYRRSGTEAMRYSRSHRTVCVEGMVK